MSIFTKDCPVCAASHPVNAVRCGCGYCFDPNKLDGVTQELEVIAQEEKLYRDYLAARAEQADQAWRAAKVAAAVEPGNTVKSAEALLAEQAARNALAEVGAQDARAQAVSARIKVVRANRRARRQAKSSAPTRSPAPVSVRAALASTPARVVPVAAPVPLPARVPTASVPAAKPVADPAIPGSPPPYQFAHTKPEPAVHPVPAPSAPTPVARHTTPPARRPALVSKPTPAFRASQATRAAQLAATPSGPAKAECPNCSGKVPPHATHCRCGYEMPRASKEIPALALSPEDRAAFLAALGLAGSDPER